MCVHVCVCVFVRFGFQMLKEGCCIHVVSCRCADVCVFVANVQGRVLHMCSFVQVCMCVCVCMCTYVLHMFKEGCCTHVVSCRYVCICVFMYVCKHTYIHTCIHPDMHTHIHTHTYIHTGI